MDLKMLNWPEEEEARISDLPDCIIHHILSFLPSTKEAIQTGILSKRWLNQWTCVPVLIFNSPNFGSIFNKKSDKNFLRLIDNTLRLYDDCSNIKKLHLGYAFLEDPDFTSKLDLIATKKRVEELTLYCYSPYTVEYCCVLPEFLFDNSSLVKLKMFYCCYSIDRSINWPCLKTLEIVGWRLREGPYLGRLVSGCPLLESFEFRRSSGERVNRYGDVIASKSLKRLILDNIVIDYPMEISCPNLMELFIDRNILYGFAKNMIEISCPNLESLELHGSNYGLVNCPSLAYANLDFENNTDEEVDDDVAMFRIGQLQHVKELRVRSWFTETLSEMELYGLSYPAFNNKILNLHLTNYDHFPSIKCALRSSPALERLVITLPPYVGRTSALSDLYIPYWNLNDCGENYWNSINETDFNCLVSHLKFVKISGLCKNERKLKLVINFIEFLLNKARVLEKLVVVTLRHSKNEDFASKVSQKVLSFPRHSKHVTVECFSS